MLQIHSSVRLDDIEAVLKAAAQRHEWHVLATSHIGQMYGAKALAGPHDAYVFTLSHSKLDAALLSADIRFASFLPSRVAAWPDADGVMLQAMPPSDYCRVLGRPDLVPKAQPLEDALRAILEEASRPMVMNAQSSAAVPSNWGATEDQVNMRLPVPQRIDKHGTKVEDEGGTGATDTLGG